VYTVRQHIVRKCDYHTELNFINLHTYCASNHYSQPTYWPGLHSRGHEHAIHILWQFARDFVPVLYARTRLSAASWPATVAMSQTRESKQRWLMLLIQQNMTETVAITKLSKTHNTTEVIVFCNVRIQMQFCSGLVTRTIPCWKPVNESRVEKSGHSDAQPQSVGVPGCQKLQMTAKPGPAKDALQLYPYGNSGRRRVKPLKIFSVSMTGQHIAYNPNIKHPGAWITRNMNYKTLHVASTLTVIDNLEQISISWLNFWVFSKNQVIFSCGDYWQKKYSCLVISNNLFLNHDSHSLWCYI